MDFRKLSIPKSHTLLQQLASKNELLVQDLGKRA